MGEAEDEQGDGQRHVQQQPLRALQEPRRLFPRYARNNLPFAFNILLQGLGVRRYSVEQ